MLSDENRDPTAAWTVGRSRSPSVAPSNWRKQDHPSSAALAEAISSLHDGGIAVCGDLCLFRAGPSTFHPLKACSAVNDSVDDIVFVSGLHCAPAPGAASTSVGLALEAASVFPSPRRQETAPAKVGKATVACPSAYDLASSSRLMRSLDAVRARATLASLPLASDGNAESLPAVMVATCGPEGLCFLGQKRSIRGYHTFVVRRWPLRSTADNATAPDDSGDPAAFPPPSPSSLSSLLTSPPTPLPLTAPAPPLEDFVREFASDDGTTVARVRALYDLWGDGSSCSGGDGGIGGEPTSDAPFVQLLCEWNCGRQQLSRGWGSPPPTLCSSVLLVGGAAPLCAASIALRSDLDSLDAFLGLVAGSGGEEEAGEGASPAEAESSWRAELELLINGSAGSDGPEDPSTPSTAAAAAAGAAAAAATEPSPAGSSDSSSSVNGAPPSAPLRADLDFTERLWVVLRRVRGSAALATALATVSEAVSDGIFFPAIAPDDATAVAAHLRLAVESARAMRYGRPLHGGGGDGDGGKELAERLRRSGDRLRAAATAAVAELGLCKARRDLLHWFETELGLGPSELSWHVAGSCQPPASAAAVAAAAAAVAAAAAAAGVGGVGAAVLADGTRRAGLLLGALEVSVLAQVSGAPWEQVRGVATAALRAQREGRGAAGAAYALPLPRVLPDHTKARCVQPLSWELFLRPLEDSGGGAAAVARTAAAAAVTMSGESRACSFVSTRADLFEPRRPGRALAFEPAALRRAQAAVATAMGAEAGRLLPQVLQSLAGVSTLAGLMQQQQVALEEEVAGADGAAVATFVCHHRHVEC